MLAIRENAGTGSTAHLLNCSTAQLLNCSTAPAHLEWMALEPRRVHDCVLDGCCDPTLPESGDASLASRRNALLRRAAGPIASVCCHCCIRNSHCWSFRDRTVRSIPCISTVETGRQECWCWSGIQMHTHRNDTNCIKKHWHVRDHVWANERTRCWQSPSANGVSSSAFETTRTSKWPCESTGEDCED